MVALLELPDELICQILSKLAARIDPKGRLSSLASGHHDIVGFALTCHRAWTLSESFLYQAVLLRKAKEVMTLARFYRTGESNPLPSNQGKGRHLKDLAIVPSQDEGFQNHVEFLKLSEVIGSMSAGQLTRLHVELPYRQTYDAQFWFNFRCTFGKSIHGPSSRFFKLPWAKRLEYCKYHH